MKLSKRSISFPILSLTALAFTVLGGFPAGPFATSIARADFDYDAEELARINPDDLIIDPAVDSEESSLSAGQLGVTVISLGAGAVAGRVAFQQNTIAKQRSRVHSVPVRDGSLDQLRVTPQQTLRELILKDTVPGDVVRLEYIVGDENSLAAGVDELKTGKRQWEARVAKLNAEKSQILASIGSAKGKHAGLPLSDQSRGVRIHFLELIERLEKQLAEHQRVQADAEMRMHAARGQFHAAEMTLESVRKAHHAMPSGYHVIRDILVDHKTATELDVFFMKNLGISQLVPSNRNIPHIRIVRIQTPNVGLAKKAARAAKVGAAGVVLAGGIIVHELTIGAISESRTKEAETQLSPQARTQPRR